MLDVGCGPGTITADLAARVAPGPVVGIEPTPGPLVDARTHAAAVGADNVTFAVGDAYALDYPDDAFDVVHAHQVLQHLGDPVAALREMLRVCAPGGVVAARDADYAAMTWYPADPRLDRWLAVYRAVAHGNGPSPTRAAACSPGPTPRARPRSPRAPRPGATPPPRLARGGAACGRTGS